MPMLAEIADFVVGVDTHKHTHSVAIVDLTGVVVAREESSTRQLALDRLIERVCGLAPGRRVWAIEQTGSYGAGLTAQLVDRGERVVEIDRPSRPARRNGAKSDELDAVRAAREALSREHLAVPRRRGDREAMRALLVTRAGAVHARRQALCQLKALVVAAPVELREELRSITTMRLVRRCAGLRVMAHHSAERRASVISLRSTAHRILFLGAQAKDLHDELEALVTATAPGLLELSGVGVFVAAQVLVSWSHAGRVRSEAAFAALAGASPIPASSGQLVRHRLSRGGDRQLNRALHNIVMTRTRHDPETQRYVARRLAEGRSTREVQRCLKRAIARQLFRFLERGAHLPTTA
jgi:transposase